MNKLPSLRIRNSEYKVISLLGSGLTFGQVANTLGVTIGTVKAVHYRVQQRVRGAILLTRKRKSGRVTVNNVGDGHG
jgi:hypothetical protein